MVKVQRYFGGYGAYDLIKTNLTKSDAYSLCVNIKNINPDYSTRTVKESNGKYSVYRRKWKQTTKKHKDAAYAANRASVERSNRSFNRDLPGWAD
ncbi:MAG: hypothetical protein WC998_07360 [Candidatus Paceibacterota bacterium]|jgi:hypothetical protein